MPRDKDAYVKVTVVNTEKTEGYDKLNLKISIHGFTGEELLLIADSLRDSANEVIKENPKPDESKLPELADVLKSFGEFLAQKAKKEEEVEAASKKAPPPEAPAAEGQGAVG